MIGLAVCDLILVLLSSDGSQDSIRLCHCFFCYVYADLYKGGGGGKALGPHFSYIFWFIIPHRVDFISTGLGYT